MVKNHKSCCYYKTVLVIENLVKMNISAANEHEFGDANVAITKSEKKTCSRFSYESTGFTIDFLIS